MNNRDTNQTMTALENQIFKLSEKELRFYIALNQRGIEGEEALKHVHVASATGIL
jgi:hypothetical protein